MPVFLRRAIVRFWRLGPNASAAPGIHDLPLSGTMVDDVVEVAPDSVGVVFRGSNTENGAIELFAARFSGGLVRLSPPAAPGRSVSSFRISPDCAAVVYRGQHEAFGAQPLDTSHNELFIVAIDGSGRLQLTSGNTSSGEIRFGSDGEHVLFGRLSVPADGSVPAVPLFPIGSESSISPDGDWVVYRDRTTSGGPYELHAVPIDGSQAPLRVSGPCIHNGDVGGDTGSSTSPILLITSDSNHVVYGADQDTDEAFELYASELPDLP